jgi:hypothetical protein
MVVLCSLGTKSSVGSSAESGCHGSTNYESGATLRTLEVVGGARGPHHAPPLAGKSGGVIHSCMIEAGGGS